MSQTKGILFLLLFKLFSFLVAFPQWKRSKSATSLTTACVSALLSWLCHKNELPALAMYVVTWPCVLLTSNCSWGFPCFGLGYDWVLSEKNEIKSLYLHRGGLIEDLSFNLLNIINTFANTMFKSLSHWLTSEKMNPGSLTYSKNSFCHSHKYGVIPPYLTSMFYPFFINHVYWEKQSNNL